MNRSDDPAAPGGPVKTLLFRFLKFNAVGLLNTAIDALVFFLLVRYAGVGHVGATVLSYSAGVLNSYLFNSLWTFRAGFTLRSGRTLRFLIVNLVSLAAALAVQVLLRDRLALPLGPVKLCAVAASVILNFSGNHLWVYRQNGR